MRPDSIKTPIQDPGDTKSKMTETADSGKRDSGRSGAVSGKMPYVYISLVSGIRAADEPEMFDYVYRTVTAVAGANGFGVVWMIRPVLLKKLAGWNTESGSYKNITIDRIQGTRSMKRAGVVITDTGEEAVRALRLKKDTLLYHTSDIPGSLKKMLDGVFKVSSFEMLIKEMERKIKRVGIWNSNGLYALLDKEV